MPKKRYGLLIYVYISDVGGTLFEAIHVGGYSSVASGGDRSQCVLASGDEVNCISCLKILFLTSEDMVTAGVSR